MVTDMLQGPALHGLSVLVGLLCGSFTSALSYRLPRGQDFVSGRSRCPKCQSDLGVLDLVPVLSWATALGRCRHCGESISARYPAIELVCAGLFLAVSVLLLPQNPMLAVLMAVFTIILLALSVIDLELKQLPNSLILWVVAVSLGLVWADGRNWGAALAAAGALLAGGAGLKLMVQTVLARPVIGWGDIKLAGALALALPLTQSIVFLAVFGVISVFFSLYYGLVRGAAAVPLGPPLCAGVMAANFWAFGVTKSF